MSWLGLHNITKIFFASTVENRLMEVPPHQMLPLMYLIDSMCMKLPHYSVFFGSNFVSNFAFVFQQISLEDKSLLHQLRVSWDQILVPNILHFLAKSFSKSVVWILWAKTQMQPCLFIFLRYSFLALKRGWPCSWTQIFHSNCV